MAFPSPNEVTRTEVKSENWRLADLVDNATGQTSKPSDDITESKSAAKCCQFEFSIGLEGGHARKIFTRPLFLMRVGNRTANAFGSIALKSKAFHFTNTLKYSRYTLRKEYVGCTYLSGPWTPTSPSLRRCCLDCVNANDA